MKHLLILISITYNSFFFAQDYKDSIIEQRVKQMGELIDSSTHILNQDEIDHFEGLAFFDVDSLYRVEATFTKSIGKRFKMPTSTNRLPVYRRYAYVDFLIEGKAHRLSVYQNMELKGKEYKNYLFIPFRDLTNASESYGGGRYLDVEKPTGKKLILDFNKSYNPYCAYSIRYSCPIPPEENKLKINIPAGEKLPVGYDKH